MNTRLNVLATTTAALLLSLASTGTSFAQQERAPTMPDPELDRASCAEVDWHSDMLREYPWVSDACHEAVIIDGQKWARFEAEFQRVDQDGNVTADFKNDQGRSLGSVNLEPGPGQQVMLDGRPTRFTDLRRGQGLNFYVPEGEFSFATEPGAASDEQIRVAQQRDDQRRDDQRLAEQRDDQRRDDRDDRDDRQLGQADQRTDDRQDRLPATAGPLPMIALGGLLSLLGGFALTMRRRFTKTNA